MSTESSTSVSSFSVALSFVATCVLIFALASYLAHPRAAYPYESSALPLDARVEDLLSRMTLEDKIGQMALIDKNSIKNDVHIRRYRLGGLLSGAGAKPDVNSPEGWRVMIDQFQERALQTERHIPLLYGVDANHGQGNVPGSVMFPHFIGLGAARNPDLVREIASSTARTSEVIGALWNYSPTLDMPRDIRWGRVYETFSDDPELVGDLASAYIEGLQGTSSRIKVAATAKHYIGAGDMIWGSSSNRNFEIDQGLTPINEKKLREEYLPPFERAVRAKVASVMVGLNQWGETKLAASSYLISDVLKGELGFSGIVVSDWYGVYEVAPDTYEATVRAVNAGIDMVMLPFDYATFVSDLQTALERGEVLPSRIDDAVRRILRVKFQLGLFDGRDHAPLDEIGATKDRVLAREAVAQSLVLLEDRGILPLATEDRIHVAGSAADNVGIQSGTWTVEWQGIDGNWLPGGTSILQGLKNQSSKVVYSKDGDFKDTERAPVGIAVVGEKPYAEGWGDAEHPRISDEDRAAIAALRSSVSHVVIIIVSGRPLTLSEEISPDDTLIAAWLPGSEGGGVADVLFGLRSFRGTLPLPWPSTLTQLPFNKEGMGIDGTSPRYPRGYGL